MNNYTYGNDKGQTITFAGRPKSANEPIGVAFEFRGSIFTLWKVEARHA